jgi:hypothetical protein
MRACGDCHSNESVWPWYSNIAPVSWLIQRDVDEGREHLNVSAWGQAHEAHEEHEGHEISEVVEEGNMPPAKYLILHPEAKLSATQKQQLIQGLTATFGSQLEGQGEDD